ncbi:MAG TPA: mechanosensitive ion channel family protein [Deltaproteobacteria bacterium]|nr:mechanosensitive ion channel family protein [Deltaproteobacteria bacterium]HQA71003.1 mechanosensitive ion channel family protein [Deltaproteobacteria bacterium]
MIERFMCYVNGISWNGLGLMIFRLVLISLIALVLARVLEKFMDTLRRRLIASGVSKGDTASETAKRTETIVRLIRQASLIVLWSMVVLVLLKEVGVEMAPILAGAGIVGLAVGFGAQNLVRDVISGFFFILEDQVRVGDVVVVNGTSGLVEEINFRTIILRDQSGVVHIFPHGTVTTLSNMTKDWSAYLFDLGVAYKENTDRVVQVIEQVGKEMIQDPKFGPLMLEAPEIFGVNQFADSAVIIKGRIKTKPSQQWVVGREFNRRIKYAFEAAGIEIPFPHRTVYFGEASKPFDLRVTEALAKASAPEEGKE